jgi:hypothetical protein
MDYGLQDKCTHCAKWGDVAKGFCAGESSLPNETTMVCGDFEPKEKISEKQQDFP